LLVVSKRINRSRKKIVLVLSAAVLVLDNSRSIRSQKGPKPPFMITERAGEGASKTATYIAGAIPGIDY
jgi:hypothetical protein